MASARRNQNLPGFVVLLDQKGGPYAGPPNWQSGFLPAAYQGTVFRSKGDPILDLSAPTGYMTPEQERARLDQMAKLNQNFDEKYPGISELSARISSYELAYRMQACAPEAVDISKESDETKKLYGLDDPVTAPYGRQCLLARRLVERGVRFVQVISGAYVSIEDTWDAHANIVSNHQLHAREVDKPITGLITDLKRRGLLDETVVMWHSEFGRMPISQRGLGRDHNPGAMTVFMTGRRNPGWPANRHQRRRWIQGRGAAGHQPRPPRHAALLARHGPQAPDVLLQRPQHAVDRRLRRADSADRQRSRVEGIRCSRFPVRPETLGQAQAARTHKHSRSPRVYEPPSQCSLKSVQIAIVTAGECSDTYEENRSR